MKKIFTLLSFIACTASTAFAQITINGDMSESAYTTLATKGTTYTPCFGPMDATAIKVTKDASNFYIGVVGKIELGNDNGISLWLNFSGLTGTAAGSNLQTTLPADIYGLHHFDDNFVADFEVDYMIVAYSGGASTDNRCYIKAARRVGTPQASYIDELGTSGLEFAGLVGANAPIFLTPGITMAFKNTGTATSGLEIKIPFAAVGLTASNNISVEAFATVVSSTGYYSNITVPGRVNRVPVPMGDVGCLGSFGTGVYDNAMTMNFNTLSTTLGTGPFHSGLFVIPVEMTNFDAIAAQNTVKLNWLTASEKNNGYFDIERSANGRDWSKIGQMKGNGTTSAVHKYAFTDESPLATVNYYRLKQVDADGASSYSATVSVNFKSGGKTLSVYPNPANDRLNLVSDRFDTEGSLEIYDLTGRLVQSGKSTSNQLDISRLNAGLYQLRLLDKTGATVNQARFSKN
jgi:hypothetical protein